MPIRARFSRIRIPSLVIFLAATLATSAQNANAGIPVLPNGGSVSGVIVTTGQDSYEFTATVGDHIELRIADTGATLFAPRIELRSPSDVFIDSSADAVVASIAHDVTETGTFTVLVEDNGTTGGTYTLYFALIPGANEHGLLTNDGVHPGTIDLGDLDTYTFAANAGDHIELRLAETNTTTLAPRLVLYAPSGAFIAIGTDAVVAKVGHDAVESGLFTVLVKDGIQPARGFGDYNLYFALIPGANEHGLLTNDGVHPETIDVGDLDTYTLTASIGDQIQLQAADINNTLLGVQLSLYDPSGAQVAIASDAVVARIAHEAAVPGTFTVLLKDGTQAPRFSGDYNLFYARIPGANEHGLLNHGVSVPGTTDLGDLDTFTLVATIGETVSLELQKTSGTGSGRLELYDPSGVSVASAASATTASLDHLAAASGTYTVTVRDGTQPPRNTGDYILTYTTDAPAVPTMSRWMLLLLAVTIAGVGLCGAASTAHQARV